MRPLAPILLLVGCVGVEVPAVDPTAELLANVEEIRQAELALQAVDDFLPCSSEAEARAAQAQGLRDWQDPGCFTRIGWAPQAQVRGGYFVTVAADAADFRVTGLADPDGDGVFVRVQATRDQPAKVVGP